MRLDYLMVEEYKNLRNFEIDFDQGKLTTVLIGENGAGKSNLIEALVLIFREIDFGRAPPFNYHLRYKIRSYSIEIIATIAATAAKSYNIKLTEKGAQERSIPFSRFRENNDFLPRYVFAYYSGPSERLKSLFQPHQKQYYEHILRQEELSNFELRRLFYCLPEHSKFVLLSYFIQSDTSHDFLNQYFGVTAFESALLVLRRPPWAKDNPNAEAKKRGDERFWYARGVVKTFLSKLWENSLAPIRTYESSQDDYRSKHSLEERIYLYIPNLDSLQELAREWATPSSFFASLESTYISDLVRDVRIRVRHEGMNNPLLFSELSEGEQQLLAVVGLLRFTRTEESLFLLDEPDTHLNPRWKLRYLDVLEKEVGRSQTSQMIISTHDPLTIAGLEADQVQIFSRQHGHASARRPEADPRGMGVAGVLTRMFGLPSTLDPHTQAKLDERNELAMLKAPNKKQMARMRELTDELATLGVSYPARDPRYERFLEALRKWEKHTQRKFSQESVQHQDEIAKKLLEELLSEEEGSQHDIHPS